MLAKTFAQMLRDYVLQKSTELQNPRGNRSHSLKKTRAITTFHQARN